MGRTNIFTYIITNNLVFFKKLKIRTRQHLKISRLQNSGTRFKMGLPPLYIVHTLPLWPSFIVMGDGELTKPLVFVVKNPGLEPNEYFDIDRASRCSRRIKFNLSKNADIFPVQTPWSTRTGKRSLSSSSNQSDHSLSLPSVRTELTNKMTMVHDQNRPLTD